MNALEILTNAKANYPQNPSIGSLVRLIKGDEWDDRAKLSELFVENNVCMCLLGHLAHAGGVDPYEIRRKQYATLRDENGIEHAVRLLAQAINGKVYEEGNYDAALNAVFNFNDNTLQPTAATADRGRQNFVYTKKSVEKVTRKIGAAILLAKAAERAEQKKLDAEAKALLKMTKKVFVAAPAKGLLTKMRPADQVECHCVMGALGVVTEVVPELLSNNEKFRIKLSEQQPPATARAIAAISALLPDYSSAETDMRAHGKVYVDFTKVTVLNDQTLVKTDFDGNDEYGPFTPESIKAVADKVDEAIKSL